MDGMTDHAGGAAHAVEHGPADAGVVEALDVIHDTPTVLAPVEQPGGVR